MLTLYAPTINATASTAESVGGTAGTESDGVE